MKSRTLLKSLPILGFVSCVTTNVLAAAESVAKPAYKTIHGFRSGLPYTTVVPVETAEEIKREKKAKPVAPATVIAAPKPAVIEAAPAKPAPRPFAFLLNPPPAKKPKVAPVVAPEVAPTLKPTAPASAVAPAKPTPRPFAFLFNPPPAKKPKAAAAAAPEVASKAKPAAPVTAVAPAKPAPRPFAFLFNPPPAKKPKVAPAPKVSNQSIAAAPAPPKKSFFSFLQRKEPPKALMVEQNPAEKKPTWKAAAGNANNLELPNNRPNDGLRLPDMLTLPGDNEFESTNPPVNKASTGTGAVIARPPTDPPSRPKTEEKDGE